MISKYLRRCRELSEKKPVKGAEKTVHNSPAYVKLLNHAIRLERDRIPAELFDGYSVLHNIKQKGKTVTTDPVNEVLDAVVDMIRERLYHEQ